MLTKSQHSALKSALTRAKRTQDPARIIAACDAAFEVFERDGYPDTWHTWNIAREDARFAQAQVGLEIFELEADAAGFLGGQELSVGKGEPMRRGFGLRRRGNSARCLQILLGCSERRLLASGHWVSF